MLRLLRSAPPPTSSTAQNQKNADVTSTLPPTFSQEDQHSIHQANRASGRQTAVAARIIRKRNLAGDTPMTSQSPAQARLVVSTMDAVFVDDFHSIECIFSESDSAMHVVIDLLTFVKKLCLLRRKQLRDIAFIKVNADDGRGSLKLMLQLIFEGDPVLAEFSEQLRAERLRNAHLDTGVLSTFIVALIEKCSESHASIRLLFSAVNFEPPWAPAPKLPSSFP